MGSAPEKRQAFQYAIVRVVPHVERGECLNAGVILFCRARRFLDARVHLDSGLLHALAPDCDSGAVAAHLDAIVRTCAGDEAAGPVARLAQPEPFHWLVAPSSTIVQVSPVHTGLTADPAGTLERLFGSLVLREPVAGPDSASEPEPASEPSSGAG